MISMYKAQPEDALELTRIAITSKAYWGYSEKDILSWKKELTISKNIIQEQYVYKGIVKGRIVGFYVLYPLANGVFELNFLFVAPNCIHKGYGKALLEHAIVWCTAMGACRIVVLSDPNAQGFYEKFGFEVVRKEESSIPGRFLPRMQLIVTT